MAAFQAANPGCMLEDFVRWYSPRDWREGGDDEKASGGGKASRGRLSARFSHPGNTCVLVPSTNLIRTLDINTRNSTH